MPKRNPSLKPSFAAALLGLALGAAPLPAEAHHSFAMFDMTKTLVITGAVKDFQWSNPHSWLYVLGSEAGKPAETWSLEGLSPSMLTRKGWRSTDLKVGDKVTVVVIPLRDGTLGGAFSLVTLPDGRTLESYASRARPQAGAPADPPQEAK
jgi:hypothetical protein